MLSFQNSLKGWGELSINDLLFTCQDNADQRDKPKCRRGKKLGKLCCKSHEMLGFLKCILIETIVDELKSEKQRLKTNLYLKIKNWLYKFQDFQILKYIQNRDSKCCLAVRLQISRDITHWLFPGSESWANLSRTFESDPSLQDAMTSLFSKHCSDRATARAPPPRSEMGHILEETHRGYRARQKGLVTGVKTQVSDRTWPKGRKTTCLSGQLKTVVSKGHLRERKFYSQGYLLGLPSCSSWETVQR